MYNILLTITLSTPNIQSNQSLKVETGNQWGTSVLVDPELVLTAAHVIEPDPGEKVEDIFVYCSGVKTEAFVVKYSDYYDLALLKLKSKCDTVKVVPFADDNPEYAQDVYSVHCPDTLCGIASKGIVSGFSMETKKHSAWMFSDLQVFFGSSGSGLMNYSGQLVGICSRLQNFSKVAKHKNSNELDIVAGMYSIWIPVSEIRKFLEN